MFVKGGAVLLLENSRAVQAIVQLENFGQTPGYDFETWTGIAVGQRKDLPFDTMGGPRQRSIIAPRADLTAPSERLNISADELVAVRAQSKVIFVWGYAKYKDGFDHCREFVFRQMILGSERSLPNNLGPGWGLTPHPDGYVERSRRC